MVFVRGAQPVCREPSEASVSSAFDLLSLFLLQDEAVEPYLQRDPYSFEDEERVMPGWAQVARSHGQGLLNHNSKILRVFYVSRWLLPQNPNLTLGAFAPQFWGVLFCTPFFWILGPGELPQGGPKWTPYYWWHMSVCSLYDIIQMRGATCLSAMFECHHVILEKWEMLYVWNIVIWYY